MKRRGFWYMGVFLTLVLCAGCQAREGKRGKATTESPAASVSMADSTAVSGPRAVCRESGFDFGSIIEGEILTHTFIVENAGSEDLILYDAESSCGCTEVTFEKAPIAPGKNGKISVTFDSSDRYGKQYKVIYIFANIPESTFELKFTANIIEQ